MRARLAILGGSFNPIHVGHLITARAVAEHVHLPKVMLIPAAAPPHKNVRDLAPAAHRLAMTRLAVAGDPLFEVSDLELHRAGPSYTIDTISHFRASLGIDAELFWLIGADTLPELASWHRIAELVEMVQMVTMIRPGAQNLALDGLRSKISAAAMERILQHRLSTPAIEISATDLRRRAAQGESIRYCVPQAVSEYIATHDLYRSIGTPPSA